MNHLVKDNENGTVTITGKCINSNRTVVINNISKKGYYNWKNGMNIVKALPDITIDDANFLVNGLYAPTYSQLRYED